DVVGESTSGDIVQANYQPDGEMQFSKRAPARHNTWLVGMGIGGGADSDGNAAGLSYGMGASLVGFDLYHDSQSRAGLYGGYVHTGFNTTSPAAYNQANGGQFGAYLTGRAGPHYYTFLTGMQIDGYESHRTV